MSDAESPAPGAVRGKVIAVSSNKGGVGKTTVAANLAIYLRALNEDLPVLLVSLDDQCTLDRMFEVSPLGRGTENLKHGWARRSLAGVIQLGQYGVHFVPAPPDTALLKARADDPQLLRSILSRTAWEGVVLLDTKSDLEALTRSAYHAADRIIVPVADRASLIEAAKIFRILEREHLGAQRGRVLFTLVDRRSRGGGQGTDLHDLLVADAERLGWPCYRTHISRSPRVESLVSATGAPQSILHRARGTAVHGQMRELAAEVIAELGLDRHAGGNRPEGDVPEGSAGELDGIVSVEDVDWKAALLRGVLRRLS